MTIQRTDYSKGAPCFKCGYINWVVNCVDSLYTFIYIRNDDPASLRKDMDVLINQIAEESDKSAASIASYYKSQKRNK
jgi:hypothetical protein